MIEEITEHEIEHMFKLTVSKRWQQVVEIYKTNLTAHKTMLSKSEDTALHVSISSYHPKTCENAVYIEQMIDVMEKKGTLPDILSMQNVRGDTPLHLAAAVGSAPICQRVASRRPEIIFLRNVNGETPMFVAARCGNLQAFLCLHEVYSGCRDRGGEPNDEPLRRTKDGDTILHTAISGEYLKLGYQIMKYYPWLINSVNTDGETPLHILAKMPTLFRSSGHLHLYDYITYHCVFVEELKQQKYVSRGSHDCDSSKQKYFPGNYKTCADIFFLIWTPILIITGGFGSCNTKSCDSTDEENQHHREKKPSSMDERESRNNGGFFPANYATCIHIFKFAMKIILTILGVWCGRIKKIEVKKERHTHALEIMNMMIEHGSSYKYDNNGQRPDKNLKPKLSGEIDVPDKPPLDDTHHITKTNSGATSTTNPHITNAYADGKSPLLVAAKMGVLEMVKKIIRTWPVAIQDVDWKGKNVVMVAAEYRQTMVFDYLMRINLPEYMFHQLDSRGNNILHLAAKFGETQPWRIPGAALQMQWEIKWYKYVKRSVSPVSSTQHNLKGETPRMLLTKTHKKLMKTGNGWLIKTSESCSVVAALIATVAFATSTTVPGGLNQDSGYPILKDHIAFDVFSIASLAALCLSITSLVFFLAITTSRHEERDFKRNLPRKLLMGLTCLFCSIATMLASFCAGHTFILRKKLRLAALPIYAFATLPVAFFAMAQLPLYFDLLWAACRKVPLRSYKVLYQ